MSDETQPPAVTAIVVGGGPGGLVAAEVLARAGVRVTVVEHRASVGRTLLLAGRSGLNLTHSEPIDAFLARYAALGAPTDRRLDAAIRAFGPDDLREWCASLGVPTFVGSSGRVFPESFRATPLLRAWLDRLRRLGVTIRTRTRWDGWRHGPDGATDPRTLLVCDADGHRVELPCDVAVFALGGASWPTVGSGGGWVDTFRAAGIRVADLEPSNCGVEIAWSDPLRDRFAGVPVKNVAVAVAGIDDGDVAWVRGDVVITGSGLEGGPIYAGSARVRDALRRGRCRLLVDLQPDLTADQLADRLARRRRGESTSTVLRRTGLAASAIALIREVGPPPHDAHALAARIKRLPLPVVATSPIDRAISSAGGIALDEIDDAFMLRRLPGTFVAGEMLDWDAPTGGYLLQAAFSTGVAAAQGALSYSRAVALGGRGS